MKKKNARKCKNCKEVFEKKAPFQKHCMVHRACIEACMHEALSTKSRLKVWKKEKREIKAKLKTKSDWIKEVQKVFNAFIRQRDKGKMCISCGNMIAKRDAGHYRSAGGYPALRFNEDNCHSQCVHCNQFLHGNLIEYRRRLLIRIGLKRVNFLEQNHEPKHYTIPELIELKEYYKNKLNELLATS